jgi:hypothetical protein
MVDVDGRAPCLSIMDSSRRLCRVCAFSEKFLKDFPMFTMFTVHKPTFIIGGKKTGSRVNIVNIAYGYNIYMLLDE